MSKIYLSGLNADKLVFSNQHDSEGSITMVDKFISVSDQEITDVEIGWDYFLVWKKYDLYVWGKIINDSYKIVKKLLRIPNYPDIK